MLIMETQVSKLTLSHTLERHSTEQQQQQQQQQQPPPHHPSGSLLCCSVAPARPDWPPVTSLGLPWPSSNSLFIYQHNYHLQKQHVDLATCALEQTSQIITDYHPAFFS
jgi:hypothetical protein